jgi:phosphoenolpyruvate---glycerone phosphotransferase subunit DhaL
MEALKNFGESLEVFAGENKNYLNELDAAQGDGDLGLTIYYGATALNDISKKVDSIQEWFQVGGKALRKAAPSTMGILLASALISVGKKLENGKGQLNLTDWVEVQKTMIEEIQRRGGANLGDKTILDAMIPASEEFSKTIERRGSLSDALKVAAEKAKASAEATANLDSKIGRSSWLGERAKGKIDGGAWLCYLVYNFLYDITTNKTNVE